MTYDFYGEFICSNVGEVKTVTSKKTGKQYKLREYDFDSTVDESNVRGLAIFADKNGDIRELEKNKTYTLHFTKYYDKYSKSEKEYVEVEE